MNYPTKKGRLISPLYLCYGNSFVYAADQLLFDISVIFLQRLLLVVFSPHSFLPHLILIRGILSDFNCIIELLYSIESISFYNTG